ncbi:kinase-like protein, partial [Conidiobolus coronatus NRRL 28638]
LGKGVSGTVFLIKRNKDGEIMAAKFTSKISTKGKKDTIQRQLNRTANEVLLLQRLHHENVVKTVDLVTHNNNLAIVMEYCPTNLFNLVKNHTLSKSALHDYFTQIATGVAYLHNEVGIAHRDLKLENICVGLDGRVKIIDFGSALSIRGLCGSDPYIAPEVWTSNDPLHPHYNIGYDPRLADIWSMGIILTAMHTGRFPW